MKTNLFLKLGTGLISAFFAANCWGYFFPTQQPPESTAVPGNVLLALSVEFPTGLQVSYTAADYTITQRYDGYFDNRKCYTYSTTNEAFSPVSAMNADATCPANTQWSGNFLNWLTMSNLDQFRSVMTGGTRDNFSSMSTTHAGDTTGRTVLIRSFSDRNAYNPIKRIRTNTPGVPAAQRLAEKWVRSGGYGSKFVTSNASNFVDWTGVQQRATCAASPLPGNAGTSWCFNIRVEVCVPSPAFGVTGNVREANCQARYTGVAKPEGLVQQYANNLRFGAFGYLSQDGNDRSGGVLRTPLKSVGALEVTSSGVVDNTIGDATKTNMEWNQSTGIMFTNPDTIDSGPSGVNNSGLMNYLNKFGYASGYKSNDPVSELFYAAQLYLRGRAPPAAWVNNITPAQLDGFPVVTGSTLLAGGTRDPMINTCQRNFMLTLGDIFTHCDGNLPGSTRANCTGGTPTDPDGLNVQNLWTTTRTMEGLAENGWAGGASNGTPYMAGLAHWANTNDIRPDLEGTQTISTYIVDVIENGNNVGGLPAAATLRSQYWLAAKYGGFDTEIAQGNNPNIPRPTTAPTPPNPLPWDKNGDGIPDTWFAGSTPALLRAGLSSAFADIAARASVGSASSAAVTSSRQTSDSQIIYAGYNPRDWSGTVRACTPTQTAAQCNNTPVWEASNWFNTTFTPPTGLTRLNAANRKIFTAWSNTAYTRMPFRWDSLNTDQRLVLNVGGIGSERVSYLRGDRANETALFRPRAPGLLGDIVNSGVTFLAGSSPAYTGTNFPGHAAYRAATRNRVPVVYVGANDGMLHAFSGANGRELFGFIPSAVFNNLPGLTEPNFQHRYFVDSTPMVGDIQRTATTWGTVLVGGLGAGGRGYYALDITTQNSFATATEDALSSLPMWEFTSAQDGDLGYTFNEPSINPVTGAYQQIAKTADSSTASGEWRVIVGNGFGSNDGRAFLYMLNANTGAVDVKLEATGAPAGANGLATPTPVDTDLDGLMDTVYAGDALGNMHKFQYSRIQGGNFVVARPTESGGAWRYIGVVFASGEPITTAPSVAQSCDGNGWNVAFGTGKLNEDPDYTDTAQRGFYGVTDRGISSSLTIPASDIVNIPYTETTLPSGNVTRNWTTPDLTDRRGWRMVFTGGERVLGNPTLPPDTGAVLFATTRPSGDVCVPGNSGFIMAVNFCTGRGGNLVVDGTLVGGVAVDSTGVIKVSNTYVDQFNRPTVVCNQDDCKENPPTLNMSTPPRGRYFWREILTK
ncbi:pilus assembly protein [Hydrogenophaga sp.]|uniref:pilus assembly protein n=1 Tax=Hydrogenophaga sp. TaxID=1904254 RepID=UPI0027266B3A|nr:PilC/PilY family type IV pilus protein [Hydrogenophaga sp.]MDO8903741.1 PilC/PilY family type IV pilus protein [Hydrogenophaga sp.]